MNKVQPIEPSEPSAPHREEREYGYMSPAARAALLTVFGLVGVIGGVLFFPAEWSFLERLGMGFVLGIGTVLCVFVARFLY